MSPPLIMDFDALSDRVLLHVGSANYQPVKPAVIARQLKLLADEEKQALKKVIKRLVKQGLIKYGDRHLVYSAGQTPKKDKRKAKRQGEAAAALPEEKEARYARLNANEPGRREQRGKKKDKGERSPSTERKNLVVGVFRRNAKGFGFVRPRGAAAGDRSGDVFIPQTRAQDASSGDLVAVRLAKGPRGRASEDRGPAGEIVEILERDKNRFVGRYYEEVDQGFVQVDGGTFAQPVSVGDAGAKSAQPGDTVVIELVRYPTPAHEGEGVIVEVLGPRGSPGVDTLSIIHEFDLPGEFREEVLDDAREQAKAFDESIAGGRLDLIGETIITIDPVDARDFDDAISLTRIANGHWRLGVHIADVTHFVPKDSELDAEARDRATSVYLPDRVIPMLPEIISNNLASLQPHKVRYTKSCFIEYTPEGQLVAAEAATSAIKSTRRFTYEEVDEFLADREPWRQKLTKPVFELLERMHALAMILRRRRFERGALELVLPEVKIDLNKEGKVDGAHVVQNTESHQVIEEFMLAANVAIAELLDAKGLHFLRRVHAPPSPRKMEALTSFVRELGFQAESLENRFELQQLLKSINGRPEERAINYAVLRSMQKAIYAPDDEGHYALAFDNYCHFTSPIRRYPDLVVHRLLDDVIRGRKPHTDFDAMSLLGEHCSEREQRAEGAERELIKVKLLNFLTSRVGAEMDAVITGVEDFGLFAMGLELPAEGFIHLSALGDDSYHYDDRSHSLVGRRKGNAFRLGDQIRVEIAHVDVGRRQLDFKVVRTLAHAPAPPSILAGGRGKKGSRDEAEAHGWQPSSRSMSGVKKHGAVQFGAGGGGPSRTYGGKRVRAKGNERFRDRPKKGKRQK